MAALQPELEGTVNWVNGLVIWIAELFGVKNHNRVKPGELVMQDDP